MMWRERGSRIGKLFIAEGDLVIKSNESGEEWFLNGSPLGSLVALQLGLNYRDGEPLNLGNTRIWFERIAPTG